MLKSTSVIILQNNIYARKLRSYIIIVKNKCECKFCSHDIILKISVSVNFVTTSLFKK